MSESCYAMYSTVLLPEIAADRNRDSGLPHHDWISHIGWAGYSDRARPDPHPLLARDECQWHSARKVTSSVITPYPSPVA